MNEFYNKMKYFEDTEGIPSEVYYHYTSLDALYNIVLNKTFRLTSLRSSNDKKELYYKPEQFLIDFANVCSVEKDVSVKKHLQLIEKSIEQNQSNFFEAFKEKSFPYALCLSEKKDNLTHWERYALGCTGVCIGLNVSALKVHLQRMNSSVFGIGIYDVGKVIYSPEQRLRSIRGGIIHLLNTLLNNKTPNINQIQKTMRNSGYIWAACVCLQLMKFAKNDSFVDEDEIRLYHDAASIKSTLRLIDSMTGNIDPNLQENLKKNLLHVVEQLNLREEKFCMTKSGIRSYRDLCLEETWGSGTISEIVLGPMCVQNCNELKRFLKANGLEGTKVLVSKVPIR